jgi:hypothetical protein
MRWHYRDPALVWLFPIAFAIHIAEEYIGGFPAWMALVLGSPLPDAAFVTINGVALAAMVGAVVAATRSERFGWMAIAIACIVVVNALAHVLGSLATGSYAPGLFSAVVLYLPLGQLALLRAWHQAPPRTFGGGIAAGVAAHAVVVVIAAASAGH